MMEEPIIRFTCRYPECEKPVYRNLINVKYCLEHKEKRRLESREKQYYRRKLKRMSENKERYTCEICCTPMIRKNKYCTKKCAHTALMQRRKKSMAVKRIDKKIKEIQKILELIK